MLQCGTNKRRTTEDRATQLMEAGGWVLQINAFSFWNFLIWATVSEISVKNGVWGPVDDCYPY